MFEIASDGQRTNDWKIARAGCVTGTGFAEVMAKLKSGKGEAKSRRDYRLRILGERLTGIPYEGGFKSAAMERGTVLEEEAIAAYEFETNTLIERAGFTPHKSIEWVGVSPDGLVGERGTVEVKCPDNPAIHLETLLKGSAALAKQVLGEELSAEDHPVPSQYVPQVQGGLWVLERDWCDFISYDPRFPRHLRLFVYRMYRDEALIKQIEDETVRFLDEIDAQLAPLFAMATPVTEPAVEPAEEAA